MQRSIINYQPLIPFALLIGLILYESIASIYIYLTPLIGIVFLYIVENYQDKEKRFIIVALFIYLTYFEIDRGLFVFSSIIIFLLYIRLLHSELVATIACKNCLKITIIILYYIGFFIFNIFMGLIFNFSLPKMDIAYVIYIISDIILVLL